MFVEPHVLQAEFRGDAPIAICSDLTDLLDWHMQRLGLNGAPMLETCSLFIIARNGTHVWSLGESLPPLPDSAVQPKHGVQHRGQRYKETRRAVRGLWPLRILQMHNVEASAARET